MCTPRRPSAANVTGCTLLPVGMIAAQQTGPLHVVGIGALAASIVCNLVGLRARRTTN